MLTHSKSNQDYVLKRNDTLVLQAGLVIIEGLSDVAVVDITAQPTNRHNWLARLKPASCAVCLSA